MFDSDHRVKPAAKVNLAKFDPGDTGRFKDRKECEKETKKNLEKLDDLQEVLYAGGEHALLIVFQAIDAGGKDGAIEHVFSGVNPQGCSVTSFKVPTELEKSHDFLWRIHAACPRKGMIGIFNRSHYESVIVERVKELTPPAVWSRRYDHINHFEEMLADEGTTIVKFFLHISKDEQKRRFQDRLDEPDKHWKFSKADLAERASWDAYQDAFAAMLGKCSTTFAPWYVVPANHKWYRNWVLSDTIVRTLEGLDLKYPPAPKGLDKIEVE